MKYRSILASLAAASLIVAADSSAQTSVKTKVSTDVDRHDGVATRTTKVVHVRKHKTHRPKKILGVKIGHKTVVRKTVRETSVSSDGGRSTTVKTTTH